MAASTPIPLSKNSQSAFIAYYNTVTDMQNTTRSTMRSRFESIDRAYQREVDRSKDHTDAKSANARGDTSRFQNITVPVIMPQVEAAVTYQTSVFLTGYPLFGVVSSPKFIDEALQIETLIEEFSIKGGWTRELMQFFRNGSKYNFAPLEVSWGQEVTATVETDLAVNKNEGVPKQVIWSGTKIRSLDPYNTFIDERVAPTECYKNGEFAGFTEYMPRIQLKAFIETLPDKIIANIPAAFASGLGTSTNTSGEAKNFFVPTVNSGVIAPEGNITGTNWMQWAGLSNATKGNIDYKDTYEVTTLYCRVLAAEFDLRVPNRNIPQVYKLIIINHQHIIYAERQTNAHAWLPILIGQPNEDGLRYQTKSLATNGKPFQEVASAYMNSILHSRRRAVTDRVLYDPSRVTKAHINSDNPSAKIPVRPAAYGKNISDAVYQFPYREDQAGFSMTQIQQLLGLSNQLVGQNQATQGQFVKGNKTLEEFDTVMQNANGRDQMSAILLESQVFVPMKQIIKLDILQFQGGTTVYNRDKQVAIEINPVQLRKAVLAFKVSDGLVPSSKIISGENFSVAVQVLGSSPQLGAGYNLSPMFSYLMKTQGADLSPFEKSEEQLAYEQALAAWSQMAQVAIENGIAPEKLSPQPLPEQFGYNPQQNKAAPEDPESQDAGETGETGQQPGSQ